MAGWRAALLACGLLAAPAIEAAPALELVSTIPLAGVKGRIDHMSADVKGHRLFVAALGNDTVEIIDTQSGQRRTLAGLGEPQGVLYLPESGRVFIANGSADRVDIVDAGTLTVLHRIQDLPDADNVRYDDRARKVVVGYGRGALRLLDPRTGEPAGEIALPGHPEAFQIEARGKRAFVNVPSAHGVVVVDLEARTTLATWGTAPASANFPMALDESGQRLFVGMRMPASLLVYDTQTGKIAAEVPIGSDADDVFYDPRHKRIYAICGEGRIDVIRQDGPDRYVAEGSIKTAARARTGLFVPDEERLYVAAPADGPSPARLLVYRVR